MRTAAMYLGLMLLLGSTALADDIELVGIGPLGDRVAVIEVKADILRGFHESTLKILTIPGAEVASSEPVLSDTARARYSRRGEYELYRQDLDRAKAALIERLRKEEGFAPLIPLAVHTAEGSPTDSRDLRSEPAAKVVPIASAPVLVSVVNAPDTATASVKLQLGENQVTLDPEPYEVVPIEGRPEKVEYRWFSVREAWRDPRGQTLLLVVDTYVPVQRSFPARSVLVTAPLGPVLEGLGVAAPSGTPVGGPGAVRVPSSTIPLGR